ncbi:hypothetical protein FGIG_06031 [Fasciola gigantica]|uniref:Vezatin n=1 Tax=Fasciola gigantica TaxID=46835 RepID=A0A504YIM8_FASGI|nr:hypothetical protein FGIG_06031 [Fasciola gigantica]
MVDDELLPKNHPLQLYLEELNLVDEVRLESAPELKVSSRKNSFSLRFQLPVTRLSSAIHSWAFDFAERFRQRILKSATDFIDGEDYVAMRHVYNASDRPHRFTSPLILVSLGLILPVSIIAASSSMLVSVVGYMFLFSGLFILLCALCLQIIHCLLRSCSNHLKLVHVPLKLCLIFLQEFDHHASFGTSHLPLLLNETVWSFPTLQKHLGLCLQFYNKVLIQLSSQLNGLKSLSSMTFSTTDVIWTTNALSYGLTSSELEPLKDRVYSNQLTFILRELKMLREVALLLESDFTSKVMGLICSTPVQSIVNWIRLIFLLWHFLRNVDSIREPLSRLDRLREYVQNGGSDSDGGEFPTAPAENVENHRSPLQKPATRLTRTILMRLLYAIKSTRHLEKLTELRDETSDSPDEWIPIFDYLRCQLEGCTATLEELQRLLLPGMIKDDSGCDGGIGQQKSFTFQNLNQTTTQTTLLARDIDPEDDVLEDVAVGQDSSDEDKLKSDDQEADVNSIVPLHSSVLKELRTALTYRRLTMKEREQKALQKRARTDRLSPAGHPVPAVTDIPSDHEALESPLVNSHEGSPDTRFNLVPNDAQNPPSITSRNGDIHLESFFSRPSFINNTLPSVPVQNGLLRRCSWEARSAVTKRTDLFRRSITRLSPVIDRIASKTDPQASVLPPRTTGITRIPLPGLVSLPLSGPLVPGANPLLRSFRPDSSFASALLAQRRKVGYAEEESFIAIGTGEEKLPEPPILKDECAISNDSPSIFQEQL